MNLYLMSPLLFELRLGRGGPDKAILYTLTISVLWLLAVQMAARRVWLAHLAMLPLYFTVGVDLYVSVNHHTRLTSSMLLSIVGSSNDAGDYLQSRLLYVLIPLALIAGGYAYGLTRIRRIENPLPRLAALVPAGALAVVYLGVCHAVGGWVVTFTRDASSPFGIFPQAGLALSVHHEALEDARQSQGFSFGATRPVSPREPETYVLVVGESSRPFNWQLYGYHRETTPRLATTGNLVVFRDVITQYAVTRAAVPLILTRATIDAPSSAAREKSIVSALHEAGFQTYWLSTQQREPTNGPIDRYIVEADVLRVFDRAHDMVLVDAFDEMLAKDGDREPKKFFVLHTQGSHFVQSKRYPRSFDVFHDADPALTPRERMVNAYDNTIRYTDHVLAEIIGALRRRPGIKAMFYVSDHGENLYDDQRGLFGHPINNEYDLPVPMLFWYSDEFARSFPDKVAAARANVAKPLNTRVMFHSVLDMAGVSVHDPNTPRLSVLGTQLSPYRRMVFGQPSAFDFDVWWAGRHAERPRAH